MALREITKKVLSYSEIPKELTEDSWITWTKNYPSGCLIECHMDDEEPDELDKWILSNYPELKDEDSFYIDMDNKKKTSES